jgi:pimeloyl-ACP methyl ester carboxylesterase
MKFFWLATLYILAWNGCAFAASNPSAGLRHEVLTDERGLCGKTRIICGHIMRPLDPSGHIAGEIPIVYALYSHWGGGPRKGVIVAQEGGPGLSSLGSFHAYKALYEPLLIDHDLIVIDARGTGGSAPIDCLPLQRARLPTVENVGACGQSLGDAADLYGTGLAREDMIAVLDRLGVNRFDYYGDSYGTFFGQTLAARYPHRLRSLVLDGAYPVIGENPWYPHAGELVRAGFNLACRRAPYCASLPGDSLQRIDDLIDGLRRDPINGDAPDANGVVRHVTADTTTLGLTLYSDSAGWPTYRDLDAAARALANGDAAPILRLVAENETGEYGSAGNPGAYSRGLFAANVCMDSPAIFDMNAPPTERRIERDEAVARKQADDPGIYHPLSISEFAAVPIDYSYLDLCLEWPIHHPPYPPGQPIPSGDTFSTAPTLVINGELDMLTPPADGAVVTRQFPNGQHLIIANSFHVDALDDVDDCTQTIVRRFTETLRAGDVRCAAAIKPVRLTPFFALKAAQAIAAEPAPGNQADTRLRSLASAAMQTASDAIARWYINYSGADLGLRGGRWRYVQDKTIVHFMLDGSRWASDLAVSGSIRWNQVSGAITADLTLASDDGERGHIVGRWNDHSSYAPATLSGEVSGRLVRATMPAP